MPDMEDNETYLKNFSPEKGTRTKSSIREEALKNALAIRKFEIEMYWKRAAYFWAFIALAFTAYFVIVTKGEKLSSMQDVLILISAGLGLFMSLCWYCVGKGSKYWQENWEKHVDWLEDDVMGPLYKRVLAYHRGKAGPFCPTKPYPFSVSKINQLLSFAICLVWLFLYGSNFVRITGIIKCELKWSALITTGFLVAFIFFLFRCCKTECYRGSDAANEDKMHIRNN